MPKKFYFRVWTGAQGETGPEGKIGPKGDEGDRGKDCLHSLDANSGILIVRHSQSTEVPECFFDHTALWVGYSISYNEYSHDLGSPSSCLKDLSMQAASCEKDGDHFMCSYTSNYKRTVWLPITDSIPSNLKKTELKQYVSRCAVCEIPLNVLVVHSQTNNEAICPTNWEELWHGYSFFTVWFLLHNYQVDF